MKAKELIYVLGDNSINGIKLNEQIQHRELHEYQIIHRESFIDELIRWIAETKSESDKILMKNDLKMLMDLDEDYIFSSGNTNDYIGKDDSNFNKICEELLELNNK